MRGCQPLNFLVMEQPSQQSGSASPSLENSPIDSRFACDAELRARQTGLAVKYEDIGDRLMELRKIAWDRYGAHCLWNVPPHATCGALRGVANGLRNSGDLEAAFLAAAILREIEKRTGRAA